MSAAVHPEIEIKYDAPVDTELLDPTLIKGIEGLGEAVEHRLEACYFDTERLDLARRGITGRCRTGGGDQGWHLKFPVADDEQVEYWLPLGRSSRRVPAALVVPVRGIVRGSALVPVARVSTVRVQLPLLGPGGGQVLALLCDDEVTAESFEEASTLQRWREWEVELVAGERGLLTAVEEVLVSSGARRSAMSSKLARALGDRLPIPGRPPSSKKLKGGSACDLLRAHISTYLARLESQDRGVRVDEAGSVHKMRIASRHLRSALTTYAPLLESDSVKAVREELRWLGQVLGEARDAQVLRERLTSRLVAQRPEDVVGAVRDRIDSSLGAAYETGRTRVLKVLDSARYFRLLETLDRLAAAHNSVESAFTYGRLHAIEEQAAGGGSAVRRRFEPAA